ncbi:gp53-like domain-containing protein [Citrobacter amalonaticus]
MNRTDAPAKQPKPFGVNGQREEILPTTPSGDNTASYESGFPPITMILKSAGGLPPKGQDMNQILYELSALGRWSSTGALNTFDSAFATAIGGYPSGAFVLGDDLKTVYRCTTDGNTSDPNSVTTGWTKIANDISDILGLGAAATKGVAANSDMQTGTSTTLLTTVANVLSLFSKNVFGISDYIRIPDRPGGLIIQWTQTGSIGSVNADTAITPRAVTFPIPFPNAALNYIAFPSAPNSTQAGVVPIASELTLTGCNVGLYNSTTTAKTVTNIIVFVVGY